MTDTMLAATAVWMSWPPNTVSSGTIKMPPAIPSVPPTALAPIDIARSQRVSPVCNADASVIAGLATSKAGSEPNEIAAIVQLLVIDGQVVDGVGRTFDKKDGAAHIHR